LQAKERGPNQVYEITKTHPELMKKLSKSIGFAHLLIHQ